MAKFQGLETRLQDLDFEDKEAKEFAQSLLELEFGAETLLRCPDKTLATTVGMKAGHIALIEQAREKEKEERGNTSQKPVAPARRVTFVGTPKPDPGPTPETPPRPSYPSERYPTFGGVPEERKLLGATLKLNTSKLIVAGDGRVGKAIISISG